MKRAVLTLVFLLCLTPQTPRAEDATCPYGKAVYTPRHPVEGETLTLRITPNKEYLHPGDTDHYFNITREKDGKEVFSLSLPHGCFASGLTSCGIRFPKQQLAALIALDKNFARKVLTKGEAAHIIVIPNLGSRIYYTPYKELTDFAQIKGDLGDISVRSIDLWVFNRCEE